MTDEQWEWSRPLRPPQQPTRRGRPPKDHRQILLEVLARQKRERRVRLDKAADRKRNVVERLVNRLKQFRPVATRDEKWAVNYLAMLTVAAITLWL